MSLRDAAELSDLAAQLPRRTRGRPTPEKEAHYQAQRAAFCRLILEIRSRMDFEVGARGWCYILEQRGLITKGDFDAAESLITECRKTGDLPLDICAQDDSRVTSVCKATSMTPQQGLRPELHPPVRCAEVRSECPRRCPRHRPRSVPSRRPRTRACGRPRRLSRTARDRAPVEGGDSSADEARAVSKLTVVPDKTKLDHVRAEKRKAKQKSGDFTDDVHRTD
jgi:hypothetical protein